MLKMRSRRLFKSIWKREGGRVGGAECGGDIGWELRPGGMLVQKREGRKVEGEVQVQVITVRISTGFTWHDISIGATSTFGDLKVLVSVATGLERREQRLLFKGKERDDGDHLHMVGVGEGDKILLLEDPAIKERKKLLQLMESSSCPTIIKV